jgi:mono/diheme cytochrome c family protein
MKRRYLEALGLLVGMAGCHGSAPPSEPARETETPQRVYQLHCMGCHGTHGEGGAGSNIQGLKRSDPQIIAVIANGQGKMPAFKGHLSPREMRELAEYVRTFKYNP